MKKYIILLLIISLIVVGKVYAVDVNAGWWTNTGALLKPYISTLKLQINSTATSTFSGGIESGTKIGAPYFNATSTTATSTLAGGLQVDKGVKFSILNSSNCDIKSDTNGFFYCGTDATGGGGGGVGFASTTSNNNSIYYYGTGSVGIGSSTPDSKLSVAGTNAASTTLNVVGFNSQTAPIANFLITTGSATSSVLLINSNGNIGLGTTTPGSLLSGGDTGANTFNISATATSTFGSGLNIRTGCFAINGTCVGGGGGSLSGGATNKVAFWTGATTLSNNTLFHFDNTNTLLGIGTSSPFARLSIDANTNGSLPIFAVGTSTSGTATSTAFIIDSNGFVGINTKTPLASLNVNGEVILTDLNAGTGKKNLSIKNLDGNFYYSSSTDSGATTTPPIFSIIQNNGGTSASTTITNDLSVQGQTDIAYGTAGNFNFDPDGGIGGGINFPIINSAAGTVNSFPIGFNTTGATTSAMVFKAVSTGNGNFNDFAVGIGTSTPWAKLSISMLPLENYQPAFTIASSTLAGATTTSMAIWPNGSMAIGTTTPESFVHVTAGTSATTTVEFGDQYSSNSKTCFNVKNNTGGAISFYFVGTSQVIENNRCR